MHQVKNCVLSAQFVNVKGIIRLNESHHFVYHRNFHVFLYVMRSRFLVSGDRI